MNVMKNALEAVEKGGYIRVEIPQEVERVVEDGRKKGFLRFTIANSVENVDAVDLDNVFELYVSSKSIARGLGMPIAYRVMEGHRGNIEFDVVGNEVRCHLLFPTI